MSTVPAIISPDTYGPDVRACFIDLARSYRDTSLALAYNRPAFAKKCRQLMRRHALKARGKNA